MFLGTFSPKLDDKGRLTLPAKYRDELRGGLMITRGQDHCLYVFPHEAFEALAQKVGQAPLTDPGARAFARNLFSGTEQQHPDGQGRIAISAPLRQYAGLAKDCTVIGAFSRLEIWDTARWAAYQGEHEDAYATAQEEVLPGLF